MQIKKVMAVVIMAMFLGGSISIIGSSLNIGHSTSPNSTLYSYTSLPTTGWVYYNGGSGVSSGISSTQMSWEVTAQGIELNDPVTGFQGYPPSSSQGTLSDYQNDVNYALNNYGTYINGAAEEYNVPAVIIVGIMCVETNGGQSSANVMQESAYTGSFTDANGVTYTGAAASIYQAASGWLSNDVSTYNSDPMLIGAAYNAGHVYPSSTYSGGVGNNVWDMMMYASAPGSGSTGYTEGSYDWKLAVALTAAIPIMAGTSPGGNPPSGGSGGSGGSGQISIGSTVQVVASSLHVRSGSGLGYTVIGSESNGATGTVDNGPVIADQYRWWYIQYNDGLSGWSASDGPTGEYLVVTGSSSNGNTNGNTGYSGTAAVNYAYYIINTENVYGRQSPANPYTSGKGYSSGNYNEMQTNFGNMGGDCAHFVSQALIAGGLSIPDDNSNYPGTGEIMAQDLVNYLLSSGTGTQVNSISELMPGDVIGYKWGGSSTVGHVALYIGNGEIAQHSYGSPPSQALSWGYKWDESGGESGTTYVLIHISGSSSNGNGGNSGGTNGGSSGDEYGITIGSTVEVVVNGLNVRSSPAGSYIDTEQYGASGSVIGGSVSASLNGAVYVWWEIQYSDGVTGWSAEGSATSQYLQVVG